MATLEAGEVVASKASNRAVEAPANLGPEITTAGAVSRADSNGAEFEYRFFDKPVSGRNPGRCHVCRESANPPRPRLKEVLGRLIHGESRQDHGHREGGSTCVHSSFQVANPHWSPTWDIRTLAAAGRPEPCGRSRWILDRPR